MTRPRYFTSTGQHDSDAVYLRHDSKSGDCVVVTATGERPPNFIPWPLSESLRLVQLGLLREISWSEAARLLRDARQ